VKPKQHFLFVSSITAVIGAVIPMASHAAVATWNQTAVGTYSWLTPTDWTPAAFPNAIGDTANLNNNIVDAQTVNLNQIIRLGTLNIGDSDGSNSMTLDDGTGGYLIMDVASGSAAITKAAGADAADTISTPIQFNDTLAITNNSSGLLTLSAALRSLTSDITYNGTGNITLSDGINTAGNLVKNDAGSLSFGGGFFAGTVTVNGGTLNPTNANSLSPYSAVTVAAGATLDYATLPGSTKNIGSLSGEGTVTISLAATPNRRDVTIGRANTNSTFNGQFLGPAGQEAFLGVVKVGSGTLTLAPLSGSSGTAAGDYTGATTLSGGTLKLDFSQGSFSGTSMLAAIPLDIGGGNLEVKGRNSGAAILQTTGNFRLFGGGGSITMDPNGSAIGTTLRLGTFAATTAGGTLLVTAPTNTAVQITTTDVTNGIYGAGRAVFSDGTANTYNWLTNTGGATPFTTAGMGTGGGAAAYTGPLLADGTGVATGNYTLSGSQTQTTALSTINTLKITATAASQSLDLATFNMTVNGLLVTGTDAYAINGSTGALVNATDLIIHQYNSGGLTINAPLSGAGALTKAGTGTLTLGTGTNAMTGAVNVNGGILSFSSVTAGAAGSLGNGSATAVRIRDGATLQYTGASGTIAATGAGGHVYTLRSGMSTIEVTGASTELELAGVISGADGGLTVKGAAGSVLKLSGVNSYGGDTRILANATARAGVAGTSTTGAFGNQSRTTVDGTLDINGFDTTLGSLAGAGTVTNSTATVKALTIGGNHVSSSYSGTFTGTTDFANVLTKAGTGIQTLSGSTSQWTGATNVNRGVLRLSASNTLNAATAVTVSNGTGPAQLELGAGFTQTVAGLTFGGASGAPSGQGNVLIGSGATLTLGGNATYTATGNPRGAVISGAGAFSLGTATRTFDVAASTSVPSSDAELTISAPISSVGAFGIDKSGTGTLRLTAANLYTGATTVTAGTLSLVGGSQASPITVSNAGTSLGFTLGSGTTSSSTVAFGAGTTVKITGTPTLPSYTLMTASSITGSPVLDTPILGYDVAVTGGNTLVLVQSAGYASWIAGFVSGGFTGDQTVGGDSDNDDMINLVEYVLNGNPGVSDVSILPDLNLTPTDFVFTFTRRLQSDADTTQTFEYGSDLIGWTPVNITAPVGAQVTLGTPTGTAPNQLQTVTVTIPKSAEVAGKLFGRLKVVK
jgi:fibronectin-binding autotransporter adhesin